MPVPLMRVSTYIKAQFTLACWKMHQTNHLKHKQNTSGVCPVAGLVTVAVDEEMTQASPTFQH
jgi:hypothetical protein